MSSDFFELFTTCGTKLLIDKEDRYLFKDAKISLGVNKLYGIYKDKEDKLKYVHREVMKANKDEQIDHINMNTFDNRKSNLRVASRSQNRANQKKNVYKDREVTSSYKGVCFDKANKNWLARVHYEGTTHFTGRFKSELSAALAYNFYAKKIFGEFARLNEIPKEYEEVDWRKHQLIKNVSKMQSGYHYVNPIARGRWSVSITINGKQSKVGYYRNVVDAVLAANRTVIENNLHMLDKYPKKIQRLSESDLIKLTTIQRDQYNEQIKELIKKETTKDEEVIGIK